MIKPWQEAMTSEQVRLILKHMLVLGLALAPLVVMSGCQKPFVQTRIQSPYGARQVWAVAPVRNETGSRYPDGFVMADELSRAFEQVEAIDVLPLNRVLEAMDTLRIPEVQTKSDAIALREALGIDALVVGTMTHYDAYDPPKMGLALDLYAWPAEMAPTPLDIKGLSWAPTSDAAGVRRNTLYRQGQPVTTISAYFDAGGVGTKKLIQDYAYGRGTTPDTLHERRLYTINMNLFQEFVGYEAGSQMIWAEWKRMAQAIRRQQQSAHAAQPPAP